MSSICRFVKFNKHLINTNFIKSVHLKHQYMAQKSVILIKMNNPGIVNETIEEIYDDKDNHYDESKKEFKELESSLITENNPHN